MKKLMVIAVMLVLTGCAGMERAEDANKPIEFVLDAPGKIQSQLFSASKSWVAETFVSGKAVIDDADKDSGRIIAKGRIKKPCDGLQCMAESGWLIGFALRIDTKDGKVRASYTNPTVISPAKSGSLIGSTYISGSPEYERAVIFRGDLDAAKQAFQALSGDLQRYLNESAANKNW